MGTMMIIYKLSPPAPETACMTKKFLGNYIHLGLERNTLQTFILIVINSVSKEMNVEKVLPFEKELDILACLFCHIFYYPNPPLIKGCMRPIGIHIQTSSLSPPPHSEYS